MFILTPIAINPSLTSKRAHVCSPVVIIASLVVPKIPQAFSLVSLLGFQALERRRMD